MQAAQMITAAAIIWPKNPIVVTMLGVNPHFISNLTKGLIIL